MTTDVWAKVCVEDQKGLLLRVKVVPGASRTKMIGLLGDRLKIAVSAPPEDGKANEKVCTLLAEAFGVPMRQVQVVEGHTRPQKSVQIVGTSRDTAMARLRQLLS